MDEQQKNGDKDSGCCGGHAKDSGEGCCSDDNESKVEEHSGCGCSGSRTVST